MNTVGLALALVVAQPPLPIVRPVMLPPAVLSTGVERTMDGSNASVPVTHGFGVGDLLIYDWNVATAFPLSAAAAPVDSLRVARARRAGEWAARVPASGPGALMDPVLGAEVAAAAGDDAGAERRFAAALAAATPSRRSYVLARAVAMFADGDRDDSALARRLTIAERFLVQLLALRPGGYPGWSDSLALVDRTYEGVVAVLLASARLGDMARVRAHTTHLLTSIERYSGGERINKIGYTNSLFPYESVAATLLGEPRGQSRLDSLMTRLQHVTGRTAEVLERTAKAELLGRRAPPVTAHAWLNTPDSVYAPAPRSHALDDGTVRLLFFVSDFMPGFVYGRVYALMPALSRVQGRIAPWGQVVVVMQSMGAVGSEIVEPPEEVAWLATMLREQLHLTAAVALWAGAKVATPDGDLNPAPAPVDGAYQRVVGSLPAIVVDGHGIVRGFFRLDSRRDEARLVQVLQYLHADVAEHAGVMPHPALVVRPR